MRAVCMLNADAGSGVSGTVTMVQPTPTSPTHISAVVKGLKPGKHGKLGSQSCRTHSVHVFLTQSLHLSLPPAFVLYQAFTFTKRGISPLDARPRAAISIRSSLSTAAPNRRSPGATYAFLALVFAIGDIFTVLVCVIFTIQILAPHACLIFSGRVLPVDSVPPDTTGWRSRQPGCGRGRQCAVRVDGSPRSAQRRALGHWPGNGRARRRGRSGRRRIPRLEDDRARRLADCMRCDWTRLLSVIGGAIHSLSSRSRLFRNHCNFESSRLWGV
jgi:hypothetical protein